MYAAPMLLLALALSAGMVFAGSKNQNGDNGIQGTAKVNDMDGCRPDVQAGSFWVQVVPPFVDGPWEGGPCCPDHASGVIGYTAGGDPVYGTNQCCNPPDDIGPQPGNHCECFHLRGYPVED